MARLLLEGLLVQFYRTIMLTPGVKRASTRRFQTFNLLLISHHVPEVVTGVRERRLNLQGLSVQAQGLILVVLLVIQASKVTISYS